MGKRKKDAAIRRKNATRKKFLLMMHRAKVRAIARAKAAAAKARAYFRMSRSRVLRKKKAVLAWLKQKERAGKSFARKLRAAVKATAAKVLAARAKERAYKKRHARALARR